MRNTVFQVRLPLPHKAVAFIKPGKVLLGRDGNGIAAVMLPYTFNSRLHEAVAPLAVAVCRAYHYTAYGGIIKIITGCKQAAVGHNAALKGAQQVQCLHVFAVYVLVNAILLHYKHF